jgi:hypothetical protein
MITLSAAPGMLAAAAPLQEMMDQVDAVAQLPFARE